jgi:SAM-dependent methyltransferase
MSTMQQQWDELARINAAYSIVSTPEFEGADAATQQSFWDTGVEQVTRLLEGLALGDTSRLAMVEIGCGIGRMTHAFAPRFARVVALDVSNEMIRRAKDLGAKLSNVEFRVNSGSLLDGVADASVDFVFSWFVLQHVPREADVLSYVRDAGRALKPGGTAFLHMRTSRGTLDSAARAVERRVFYLLPVAVRRALKGGAHLEDEFAARFRVWRGCAVRIGAVEKTARAAGLAIDSAEPAGEGFTAFRLRKR